MSIEYNVTSDGLRIEVHPKGLLNIKETMDYFNKIKDDKKIKHGAVEIVYFTNVTDFKISYDESEKITKSFREPKSKQMIEMTIFVCETTLAYGIGRMLQAHHENTNPGHRVYLVRTGNELESLLKQA